MLAGEGNVVGVAEFDGGGAAQNQLLPVEWNQCASAIQTFDKELKGRIHSRLKEASVARIAETPPKVVAYFRYGVG